MIKQSDLFTQPDVVDNILNSRINQSIQAKISQTKIINGGNLFNNITSNTISLNSPIRQLIWAEELKKFIILCPDQSLVSPDGVNWTYHPITGGQSWNSITWSPELGLLVAVSSTGTGSRVITSPDGENWTFRSTPADNGWTSIVWSSQVRLLVAVAGSGTDRVMTSPDGINWTGITSADETSTWTDITWSPELNLFVAVAVAGTDRVMTSPDGINWTGVNVGTMQISQIKWSSELGIFSGLYASTSTYTPFSYSYDGINWQNITLPDSLYFRDLRYYKELQLFTAYNASSGYMYASHDGVNWEIRPYPRKSSGQPSQEYSYPRLQGAYSPSLGRICMTTSISSTYYALISK